jgi:hypothetical protein
VSGPRALVRKHVEALRREGRGAGIPCDVIGRALLAQTVELFREERDWDDIASELRFTADNLDPATDFEFMRP